MSSSLASAPNEPRFEPAATASECGAGSAVRVRGIGKCYGIYARPLDRLKQTLWRGKGQFYKEFWALRGVSFEVGRGEAVGIIGRNGSGKSTLLQIIAGTLRPTEGEVEVRGRVAALLELGSGFNPEFSGRENVYLNGSILGLSPQRISDHFDEIAAFADIGDFLNMPVKTYSTGMVVRLAFAVQLLLEPDVLIIDEALAVGDEGFQRKCFGWLESFREKGGTLLFVTHAAQTVIRLCDRAVLLDKGRIMALGQTKPVTDIYQRWLYGTAAQREQLEANLAQADRVAENVHLGQAIEITAAPAPARPAAGTSSGWYDPGLIIPPENSYGTGDAEILEPGMFDAGGQRVNVLCSGQACEWRYRVEFRRAAEHVRFGMMLKTKDGLDVVGVSSTHLGQDLQKVEAGESVDVSFRMHLNVAPGTYFLNSGVSCLRGQEEVFLHRRVDVAAVRVTGDGCRDFYGLAFVDPQIEYVKGGKGAGVDG